MQINTVGSSLSVSLCLCLSAVWMPLAVNDFISNPLTAGWKYEKMDADISLLCGRGVAFCCSGEKKNEVECFKCDRNSDWLWWFDVWLKLSSGQVQWNRSDRRVICLYRPVLSVFLHVWEHVEVLAAGGKDFSDAHSWWMFACVYFKLKVSKRFLFFVVSSQLNKRTVSFMLRWIFTIFSL